MIQREHVIRFLRRTADLGFLAVLLLAPWFMGGRHPVGRLVLAGCVSVAGMAWGGSQWLGRHPRWSWSGAEAILMLAVGLVVLQLLPLPFRVLQLLSPSLPELLPLWSGNAASEATWGTWQHVSLTPEATREGLCMLLVYGVLFVATYQRLQQLSDIEWMLRWLAMAAIAMATVGLLQHLAGNGKFLWIYAHPSRDPHDAVKGAFANQNHFAHFLALGLGPLIWWLRQGLVRQARGRDRFLAFPHGQRANAKMPVLLTGGIAVVVLAILLTCSRGGMLATTGGTLTCLIIYAYWSLIDKRTLLVLMACLVLVVLAVWIRGEERLGTRVATITSGSLDQLDGSRGRRNVWSAALRAVPDFAILGSGVGSHRDLYPRYFPQWSDVEYTHTENGYLQILLETGVCGLTLLLSGCALVGYWLGASLSRAESSSVTACGGALAAGCVVSAVHAVVDFVWYIPACMSVVVMLMAAAARLNRITRPSGSIGTRETQRVWPAGVFALIVLGLGVGWIHTLSGPARAAIHWDNYLAMSLAAGTSASDGVRIGRQREFGTVDLADPQTLATMASHLQQSLRWYPHDARANLRYATVCLRRFEQLQQASDNAMGLLDLREAAQASTFPSQQAQERWLSTVMGDRRAYLDEARRAAIRAVQLCPLQGQAYLHLAELAFLHHPDPSFEHRLLDQAQRVRPTTPPSSSASAGKRSWTATGTWVLSTGDRLSDKIPTCSKRSFRPSLPRSPQRCC